jgi:CRISPR-associated endonuclease/helicase Cas3
LPALSDVDLAGRLYGFRQVLCIVQTRRAARCLFEHVRALEGTYHLSALMCPAHRSETLKAIRERLLDQATCRVVSTSLVEAGVDIDFPVVFRSLAGIDSIAQAAGRCNREGRLPDDGQVFVFEPEQGIPPGPFRRAAEAAAPIIRSYGENLLGLDAVREYFRQLYWMAGDARLDAKGIIGLLSQAASRGDFPFREVSEAFRLIEDVQEPVIIPYNEEACRLIKGLRHAEKIAGIARRLQRFSVSIHSRQLQDLVSASAVQEVREGFWVLKNNRLYRNDVGLDVYSKDPVFCDPEDFLV